MNEFRSDLVLIPQSIGRTWALDEDLVYHSDRHGDITVHEGFECDLSSIPRFLWWFSPPSDFPHAGVVHDWAYRTGVVDRWVADDLYRECLIVGGCGRLRARVRWLALRLFGFPNYRPAILR